MEKIISERYAGKVINGPVTGSPIRFDREGVGKAEREDVLDLIKHPRGFYRLPEGEAESLSLDAALEAFAKVRASMAEAADAVEAAARQAALVDRVRAASKLEAFGLDLAEVLGEDDEDEIVAREGEADKSPDPEPEPEPIPVRVAAIDAVIDEMHHNAARALAKRLGGDPQSTDEARLYLKQKPEAQVRAAIEEARG